MPQHVRSIVCCYCGGSTLVNLRDANNKTLKCGECGAGMAIGKMAHVSEPRAATGRNPDRPRQVAPQWEGDREWRGERDYREYYDDDDDDDRKRRKPRKKKGFFDRLEDLWDEVEDIFD